MALTERAMQVVQAPLRLVQHATGDTEAQLEETLQPLRTEFEGLRGDLRSIEMRLSEVEGLRAQLRSLEKKLDKIYKDTQHLRTEQAAERTEEKK